MSRSQVGADNPQARLDEGDVREIWRRLVSGATAEELSAAFGVSKGAIQNIAKRRTWAHLDLHPALPLERSSRNSGRAWSPSEIRYIQEHPHESLGQLSTVLGRTRSAVHDRKRSGILGVQK